MMSKRTAVRRISRFYRTYVAGNTAAALAERFVAANFTHANLAMLSFAEIKTLVQTRTKTRAVCTAMMLRMQYVYLKHAPGSRSHAVLVMQAKHLGAAFVLNYHRHRVASHASPQTANLIATAAAFTAAVHAWVAELLRRGDVRQIPSTCATTLYQTYRHFIISDTLLQQNKTGLMLADITRTLDAIEFTHRNGPSETWTQYIVQRRVSLMQELEDLCGRDKSARFHAMLIRRLESSIPTNITLLYSVESLREIILPRIDMQSAYQLAAELLVNENFTLNDSCLHVYPGDTCELHQRSAMDDPRWDAMCQALDPNATPNPAALADLRAAVQAIHDALMRFGNRSRSLSIFMHNMPTVDNVIQALVACDLKRSMALLNALMDGLMHVCETRRTNQISREWDGLAKSGVIACLRFMYERAHLLYVDDNNAKIRSIAPFAAEHAPPVLREQFNRINTPACIAKTETWLAEATRIAVEIHGVSYDDLRRGCPIATSNVLAVGFARLLDPWTLQPETLRHYHRRHVELMKLESQQLALGVACIDALHKQSSYQNFYHEICPCVARITRFPTRAELCALAGMDVDSTLPDSTIYLPRGTSWLSVCDFTPLAQRYIPTYGRCLSMHIELELLVIKILLKQDAGLLWERAWVEIAPRIYALAGCVRSVARASALVHWDLYAEIIRKYVHGAYP